MLFDYKKIADRKTKVVRKLVAGIKMKMENHNVEVVRGDACIESGNTACIKITCNGQSYEAAHLLVCTGSEAFVPLSPASKATRRCSPTARFWRSRQRRQAL